jgi:hypothetical protein
MTGHELLQTTTLDQWLLPITIVCITKMVTLDEIERRRRI